MARPHKEITKEKNITVHCSYTDHIIIKKYATITGLSMSQYLLQIGLRQPINAILSQEELVHFRNLTAMGNNLNQIAKHLNSGGALSQHVLSMLKELQLLIAKFYDR